MFICPTIIPIDVKVAIGDVADCKWSTHNYRENFSHQIQTPRKNCRYLINVVHDIVIGWP